MLIERFTLTAQDGIERGCRLAVKGGHRYVTPAHLVLALLEQEDGVAKRYFGAAKIEGDAIAKQLHAILAGLPKADVDAQDTPVDRDLEAVFIRADEIATAMDDKYIGVNHLILGALDDRKIGVAVEESGGTRETLE